MRINAWEDAVDESKMAKDAYLGDKGTLRKMNALNRVPPMTPPPVFDSMARKDRMFTQPVDTSLFAAQSLKAQVEMIKAAKGQ